MRTTAMQTRRDLEPVELGHDEMVTVNGGGPIPADNSLGSFINGIWHAIAGTGYGPDGSDTGGGNDSGDPLNRDI